MRNGGRTAVSPENQLKFDLERASHSEIYKLLIGRCDGAAPSLTVTSSSLADCASSLAVCNSSLVLCSSSLADRISSLADFSSSLVLSCSSMTDWRYSRKRREFLLQLDDLLIGVDDWDGGRPNCGSLSWNLVLKQHQEKTYAGSR